MGNRRIDYNAVIDYAKSHPRLTQTEIARHFKINLCTVNSILAKKVKTNGNRKVDYAEVLAYSNTNPLIYQKDIAKKFGLAQPTVSQILRSQGKKGIHRGWNFKKSPKNKWEQILHDYGLGMNRGLTIGGKSIFYGETYLQKTEDFEY